ncbi:MAG: MFS transporter [Clostridia bacterium]|nr:MFS transporter [Clostridia bacterium]
MVTLLFIIILAIFIGLGLPDSLLGSAWPAIYPELNLPVSYANFLTILISSGTVLASLFSARLINKFGTGAVTAVSTAVTALGILGFSFSQSLWWFIALALPLGAGAGAIDAALNNYVAIHYSSTHMSLLHCFYGVGVATSPYLMSLALNLNNDWRLGYRTVFFIMAGITVIALIALPLWGKIKAKEPPEENFTPVNLSLKQMLKMPAVRTAWIVFFSSVALEFTCGVWGCTYLVSSQGLSESMAAEYLTLFYLGLTSGRLVSGIIAKKVYAEKIVYGGYFIVGVAIIMIALPVPLWAKGLSLFLIGFGIGPTFPNLTHLTPINFGKEISQSVIGTQMACCNLGILLMPPVFGLLAQHVGAFVFPYYLIGLYALMLVSTIIYSKLTKTLREKRKPLNPLDLK